MTDTPPPADGDDHGDELRPEDRALLAEVQDVLAADPPPEVLDAARGAFAWRRVDEELAELLDEATPAGVRGPGAARLAFADSTGRRIEAELHPDGGRVVVTGLVVPAQAASVHWEVASSGESSDPVAVDAVGGFELTLGPAPGPFRLVVSVDGRRVARTDWVVA